MGSEKTIEIFMLNPEWVQRAHPLLMIFKGGHRAKAGEWFLEVQRVLYDIYQTFVVLENFMNRGHEELYVGEKKNRVEVSEMQRVWVLGYTIENAYLRVPACLDKIAQMVRVYYEHPDHGGDLILHPRCGNCPPEKLEESNCSFGALLQSLHKEARDPAVDGSLFALERSAVLSAIKKARNDISHRINKNIFYPGLDPDIQVKIAGHAQETTFAFGRKYPTPEEYRKLIADAHNEIVAQLNILGPLIFPAT